MRLNVNLVLFALKIKSQPVIDYCYFLQQHRLLRLEKLGSILDISGNLAVTDHLS